MSTLDTAAAAPEPGALLAGHSRKRVAVAAILGIIRRSLSQKWLMGFYIGLYLVASFATMASLFCFKVGSTLATGEPISDGAEKLLLRSLGLLGFPSGWYWSVLFTGFILLQILVLAIDHWGRIIRLRLLSRFEADLMKTGLRLACDSDPRQIASFNRREMVMALRSDCKAMRIILQSVLQIVVGTIQPLFTLIYIFYLDVGMSLLGVGLLLAGFYPVYLLGRKAGGMTFRRQEVAMEAGSQVSGMIGSLQNANLVGAEKSRAIESIGAAIADQHRLWRQQHRIRSLCEKAPALFSYLGIYAIMLLGMQRINHRILNWADLLTFIIAARTVFSPFSSVGNRAAKISENVLRAGRYIQFVKRLRESSVASPDLAPLPVVAGRVRVESIEVRALDLPQPPGGDLPPLDLLLARGDVLTIVDPNISCQNPLYQAICGIRATPPERVFIDGRDVNTINYGSMQAAVSMLRIADAGDRLPPGPILDCLRLRQPGLTADQAVEFARLTIGQAALDEFPAALDTHIDYSRKRMDGLPRSCYRLVNLFCKHVEASPIQVIDGFEDFVPETHVMLRNYVRAFQDRFIYIWLDRTPPDLPSQHIVAFRNGLYLGGGDPGWFASRFPDWQSRVAAADDDESRLLAEIEEAEEIEEEEG